MRKWAVTVADLDGFEIVDLITLKKLQNTIKDLKLKDPKFSNNKWGSPIVPLLIEHIFLENFGSLDDVVNITLDIRENKDTTPC